MFWLLSVMLKVLSAQQHAVYLQFLHQDKEEVCVFSPGRMFVNGKENLLRFAVSVNVTKAIFPEGSELSVQVQRLATPFKAPFSLPVETSEKAEQPEEKRKRRKLHPRSVNGPWRRRVVAAPFLTYFEIQQ